MNQACPNIMDLRSGRWSRNFSNTVLWIARPARTMNLRGVLFTLCCFIVTAVSVHDAILIVVNHEIINEVEQNPVGMWLLELQGGDVWLFVALKLVGTSLVGAVLITIYKRWQRIAMSCVVTLAAFQTALLGYLTFV